VQKGAFQVSREIFENEIWTDVVKFRIFFYILGNAVFSKEGVMQAGIRIERGQYLRSLRNLQDDLSYREGRGNAVKKIPLETLRRRIKSLEKEGRITIKSTEYGTLFTVVNYALYQSLDNYKKESMGQRWDSNGTAMGQQWDNNKNVKECSKNEKNEYIVEIINYLNNATGKNYRHTTKKTRSLINARIKEGFAVDDFKKVIDTKNTEWKHNQKMQKFLRPETLFGTKFESYLNQNNNSTVDDGYDYGF